MTGPVARGDWATVAGHIAADGVERPIYAALAEAAWLLHHDPGDAVLRLADRRTSGTDMSDIEQITEIRALRERLDEVRATGRRVGLVPTMGYLHDGHVSLMDRSAAECDVTVVTIFVNPLQVRSGRRPLGYPRDLPRDLERCETQGSIRAHPRSGRCTRADRDHGDRAPGSAKAWRGQPANALRRGGDRRREALQHRGTVHGLFGEKDFQQLASCDAWPRDLGCR